MLMVAAIRQSSAPTARKTQRHVTAFGTRVPPEIEEVRDFEMPEWLIDDAATSENGDEEEGDDGDEGEEPQDAAVEAEERERSSSIEFVDDP